MNAEFAYAVSARGEVFASRDGGQTWRLAPPYNSLGGPTLRVKLVNPKRGVAVEGFGIVRTADGRET